MKTKRLVLVHSDRRAVVGHLKNSRARLNILKMHRLLIFEETFDRYLAGEVDASYLAARAKAMLAVGLPRIK